MRTFVVIALVFLGFTASAQDKKETRKQSEYAELTALIDGGEYEFIAQRAIPTGTRQIDLTTNPNYLRIIQGNGQADMPYFGRAFSAGYSSSDGGIKFDGPLLEYEIEKNDKKMRITIKFKVKGEDDTYTCNLTVYGLDNASLNVISNKRQSISYNGYIQKLKAED